MIITDSHDNWCTPKELYDKWNSEFNFDFDPCPLNSSFDGLNIEWGKSNYVNPPYNRIDKPKFIKKAYDEWKKGKLVVMLLPVCTSTKQFHEIILPNCEIRFIKGRIKFVENGIKTKQTGTRDLMLVIFRSNKSKESSAT